MSGRHVVRVALLALALCFVHGGMAAAAQTTIQPQPAEARTFATTNGGWSSSVDYGGLVCIPGVTCPSATPSYQATGGAGGAGDGFLRDGFGTLLGVLSTTTITWTSPSFAAPATAVDEAALLVDVRPQIASLLAIGSLNLRMRLVDVTDPARSTTVATVPLTAASATFSSLIVNVPPSAVVAGHTYRIALDVALTTAVSAVTSGNVDLDNVILRLVDLEPPTGLTATVPGSGPTRVEGSVDPAGQTTSVTVEYGLTTAYDTTTSPVTVNGSGSRSFSIPLGGLTPGATYHYRVVALNADGIATTTDATFVAPVPPAGGPPVVSGAGNSRNRTATFTRDGTIVRATVEVLAAGGSTVLGSFDDADGDGSVAITLPDADGTYDVRVVRENDARLTSTSTPVQATLDRVGPDGSAIDLRVLPAVSSDTQRNVTFTPPVDAVRATAQVIDRSGNPVGAPVAAVGGTATVQIGPAEGDYRVRLTLEDAAGNPTVVTSDVVTLDETAPSAGGAPSVTGPGNSRDRTVRFDRDLTTLTATIEVVDSGGRVVATAPVGLLSDTGTVTLPDRDGDYGVRVRQTDLAGNSATTASTPVTLDRVAPNPGPAPTVIGADSSRDRDVSFQRAADATSATIEVVDRGGSVVASAGVPSGGSGRVTLPDADGDYTIRVRQTDAATNSATSPGTPVTLDRSGPDAGPAPAVTGPGNSRDRTVAFTRAPDADRVAIEVLDSGGRLLSSTDVPSGGSGSITLPDADGGYDVRVRQTDAVGNSATTPNTPVTLDRQPPAAGPAPTVTGADTALLRDVAFTRAPDADRATIEVLDGGGRVVATADVPSGGRGSVTLPDTDGSYDVRVTQTDAAGNSAVTPTTPVVLDRGAPDPGDAPTITGAGNSRDRTVEFRRAPDAARATIEVLDGGGRVVATADVPAGGRGSVRLPAVDGVYFVRVRQADAGGISAVTPTTDTTLDTSPPDPGDAPTVSGTADALTVTFRRAPDAASATIEVLDANGNVVARVPVPSGNSGVVDLPDTPGLYGIRVVQTDAAGNSATTPTTNVRRLAGGDGGGDDGGRGGGGRGGSGGGGSGGSGGSGGTGSGGGGGGSGGRGGGSGDGALPLTDPGQFGTILRQCFGGDVVVTDVTARGARVQVRGLTLYAPGTAVSIVDLSGRRVGQGTTDASGRFAAAVTAPRSASARLRGGYRAVVGRTRSPAVRLRRANVVTGLSVSGSTITIRGRVDLARLGSVKRVRAYGGAGAAACTNSKLLRPIGKTLVNRRTGAYQLRVRAPAGTGRLVLRTRVFGSKLASRSSFLVR
ncbi:Ig-like domain repeat protein [Conexibacter woesei]|uniref:Fibronectin type III domain protein n=1 Tax=Conexibacter woesei (strain DSM 14684 / CCUG 47730 / CIP 108061 / JCM 11494 / NBRC 100937 / ID131577) TaxID=469383 RepID=D3FBZ1_CONWI|nr:Ig-like domain repeat protein [Conexibacter woesei]ADB51406.1 Fibronectin type III domain protein [Conexibacter woesei DSM 14684]